MFELLDDKKVFSCPFCGISYKKRIPAGSVHLGCCHCGATFFVPPQLGGLVHYCAGHPENQAIGLCDNCRKNYCDHCLHILTFNPFFRAKSLSVVDKKIYLCAGCLKKRKIRSVLKGLSIAALLIAIALFLSLYASLPPEGQPIPRSQTILIIFMFGTFSMGLLSLAHAVLSSLREPTIHEKRETSK